MRGEVVERGKERLVMLIRFKNESYMILNQFNIKKVDKNKFL